LSLPRRRGGCAAVEKRLSLETEYIRS
jgi:hypothetical protein